MHVCADCRRMLPRELWAWGCKEACPNNPTPFSLAGRYRPVVDDDPLPERKFPVQAQQWQAGLMPMLQQQMQQQVQQKPTAQPPKPRFGPLNDAERERMAHDVEPLWLPGTPGARLF